MKKDLLSISLAALTASVVFTACSSDELETTPVAPKSNVINLTSSLAQTRAASELQTNAVSTDVKVGAFGVSGSSTISNGNNNQYTVASNGNLSASSNMAWPSDASATVSIYAYAPYQSGWAYNSANTFSVSSDQSSDANYLASDLLYAKAENKTQTTDAIALNFTHQLARINVKITKSSDADININGAAVYIINTKPSTTLNPSTGELGAASGSETAIKVATLSSDAATTVYGIVVPQSLEANTQFIRIVTSEKTLVAKLGSAVNIESGKSYNYTANIKKSGSGGGDEPGGDTEVELTLGSVTLTGWGDSSDLGSSDVEEVEYTYSPSSFVALASNQSATYTDGTYSWTAASNNLMTILEFPLPDGKTLANIKTLEVTTSNLSENGKWRLGYVVDGSSYTNFSGFSTDQTGKTGSDLTALTGVDLSKVTKIQIGGATGKTPEGQSESVNTGSLKISPSDVVLKGYIATSGSGDSGSDDPNKLYASFGTPDGNASYDATSFTYTWSGSTGNLMNCFTLSNGELANYTQLVFKFSGNNNQPVRVNFVYGTGKSDNMDIGTNGSGNSDNKFYSEGSKTITMTTVTTALSAVNKTLADVTAIRFGGASGSGSCVIKASDMYLEK